MNLERAETGSNPREKLTKAQKLKVTAAYILDGINQWTPRPSRLGRAGLGVGVVGLPLGVGLIDNYLNGTGIVEAAEPCSVKLVAIGVGSVDHPLIPGRLGLGEANDFVIGAPAFGQVVINYQETPSSPRTELMKPNLTTKDNHAQVVMDITGVPNTKGKHQLPAIEVLVSFEDDPVRQAANPSLPVEKPVTVECGQRGWVYGTRQATKQAIETAARGGYSISKIGTVVERVARQTLSITTGMAPTVDNSADNLKVFTANIGVIQTNAEAVRAKELAAAPKPQGKGGGGHPDSSLPGASKSEVIPDDIGTINNNPELELPAPVVVAKVEPISQPNIPARASVSEIGATAGLLTAVGLAAAGAWKRFKH